MSNQNIESSIKRISDEILTHLLAYREQHPDFTFCLRTRDSIQSKEERLGKGYWFQGSNYIFVPLYKQGDNNNKTKTIGFVITFDNEGNVNNNYLEIAFGAIEESLQPFYKKVVERLGVKLNEKEYKYFIPYPDKNYLKNLNTYITTQKAIIDTTLTDYKLDNHNRFKPTNEEFTKWLNNIQAIRNNLRNNSTIGSEEFINNQPINKHPLNQILFGPPGTGKTYHTINKALAIIENKPEVELEKEERKALKERFEKYAESGQIVFTTFHQSMSYEDFIEGIKPLKPESAKNIQYDIVDGVFKKIANKAFYSLLPLESKQVNSEMPSFETLYSEFLATLNTDTIFKTISYYELKLIELKGTSIIVMFKWQNTAKTIPATQPFSVTKEKIKQLFEANLNPHEVKNLKQSFEPFFKHNLSVYYAVYRKFYEFVEKKVGDTTIQQIESSDTFGYEESKERWSLINESQQKELISKSDNYVLIIDEINRGNVSQIFGELITLIEEDKRLGKGESLEVMLPYSKEKFGVPPNLYIIGTMNTADRSVEALDTALRRRFSFVEMPPKYDLQALQTEILSYKLQDILQIINKRIEKLLNKDNLIGHSYFLSIESPEKLQSVFQDKIIPLLQEYFFGDYGKIGLVLGNGFVEKEENKEDIFYNFEYNDGVSDFTERPIYRIKNVIDMTTEQFKLALDKLLKRKNNEQA